MSRPTLLGRSSAAPRSREGQERGQLLVIFALALIALIGMVGLIIDGGDSFLQRRDQQNVADAAAMAAGYASVNGQDPTTAARTIASANGYTNGVNGASVNVTVGATTITVDVSRPHQNYFAGMMGFASWGVSATASVQAGIPNAAYSPLPLIFNKKAFDDSTNKNPNAPKNFDEPLPGNNDVPKTNATFNWTVFCTANGNACNGNSDTVKDFLVNKGTGTTVYADNLIGPLNNGAHTDLFSGLAGALNASYPVAIVNDDGAVLGFATFMVTGSNGGSTKQVSGYFIDQINSAPMVIAPGHEQANGVFGSYTVKLTN